jgi:putative selenium metabolism protein SsnA
MIITNGKLITWEDENQILEGYAIYIKDQVIKDIGPQKDIIGKYPQEQLLNANGQYVMPGNICAHTHFYGAFARGMGIPGTPAKEFPEILAKLWFPLDNALSMEDVRYSALVGIADAIRHGTTTLIDHHASYSAIEGSLQEISKVVDETGMRASLCYEVSDRHNPNKTQAAIEENVNFINYVKEGNNLNGRLSALFGLHASLTLSAETLEKCRAAVSDETGFHIHVGEHHSDEYDSLAKSGMRVIDRLNHHGILGPNTITAHGVHIDAKEIQLLAENRTWLTHQPRSNMNNGVGIGDVSAMLRAGVKVCLGNDGMGNDMWSEWKTAYLVHKLVHLDPRWMPANIIVDMAIQNNSALATSLFKAGVIGKLEKEAQADIIFVDYHPYSPLNTGNLPWQIVFGFNESMITTTIVAGKILMKDRKLLTIDEEAVTAYARENLVPKTWDRYQKQF